MWLGEAPRSRVTQVIRTSIVVVADDEYVETFSTRTRVICACVIVIAILQIILTDSQNAGVNRAGIFIVTIYYGMGALTIYTGIIGAGIPVTAING